MLAFSDELLIDHIAKACLNHNVSMIMSGHQQQPNPSWVNVVCYVCQFKKQFWLILKSSKESDNNDNQDISDSDDGSFKVYCRVACKTAPYILIS